MTTKKLKLTLVFFLFLLLLSLSYSLTTLTVTEGELVKITPKALDPDQDPLTYTFHPPLNQSGQWQTTLDDAGTYQTKLIVSDNQSQTEEEIVIIVKNKNQPPQIKYKKFLIQETETINLKPLISDPDNDSLTLLFEEPFNQEGVWQTTYDDAGIYQTKLIASDLEFKTTQTIDIEIQDKNRLPEILSLFSEEESLQLTEDTTLTFSVSAQDLDQDPLTYSWLLNEEQISTQPSFDHYFNFDSAGQHQLTLIISDQKSEIQKTWLLEIKNLNRPPEIDHPDIIVDEAEKIILQLPEIDEDGDLITYTFQPPLQEDGTWQTTYEDAGLYTSLIIASDGELTAEKELQITINDVDRAPLINLEDKIELNEEEKLKLDLEDFISDPDNDKLTIFLENLPPDATFENHKLKWRPDYNFIQRKQNFFTDFLNRLRIEKYFFPPYKKIKLPLTACGKQLCSNQTLILQVNNLNRQPILQPLEDLTITETETISLNPQASDPDNDIITYHFEKPFNRKGEWRTDYDDQTEFTTTITASDGQLTDNQTLKITVLNKNRPPTLEIKQDYFKLNENQPFTLQISAQDPDNDNLTLYAENLTPGASFQNKLFSWTPPFDTVKERKPSFLNNLYAKSSFLNRRFSTEMEHFTINFIAFDGEFQTTHPITITVKNINQPPEITDYFPAKEIIAPLNQPVTFHANILDPDQENLTHQWSFGYWDRSLKGPPTLKRTFKTPGLKTIKLTSTDNMYQVEQEWKVEVKAPKKPTTLKT